MDKSYNYRKCFVAYLDLLGFRNIVADHEASTIIEALKKLKKLSDILTGENLNNREPKIHGFLVSDTVLLFSEKDDLESFKYMVGSVRELICDGISSSVTNITAVFPMRFRGAISWGDFYFDEKEKIFFGPAFHDAYDWENKQKWIGAILTPTCADYIRDKGYLSSVSNLVEYNAPIKKQRFKCSCSKSMYLCINWTEGFACNKVPPPPNFFKDDTNKEVDKKLRNTGKFYKYITK